MTGCSSVFIRIPRVVSASKLFEFLINWNPSRISSHTSWILEIFRVSQWYSMNVSKSPEPKKLTAFMRIASLSPPKA